MIWSITLISTYTALNYSHTMHLQISFAIHDPTKFLHYNADTKGKFVGTLGTICQYHPLTKWFRDWRDSDARAHCSYLLRQHGCVPRRSVWSWRPCLLSPQGLWELWEAHCCTWALRRDWDSAASPQHWSSSACVAKNPWWVNNKPTVGIVVEVRLAFNRSNSTPLDHSRPSS